MQEGPSTTESPAILQLLNKYKQQWQKNSTPQNCYGICWKKNNTSKSYVVPRGKETINKGKGMPGINTGTTSAEVAKLAGAEI